MNRASIPINGAGMLLVAAMTVLFPPALQSEEAPMGTFSLSSPSFGHQDRIPRKYTCDEEDVSPPLSIKNVPPEARSLALIVDDPDAPGRTWVHWVVWNIDPKSREIGEGRAPAGAAQGTNDFRRTGYGGPCPPSGTHRYFFKLYALDAALEIGRGGTKADLERAMSGHILAQAELIGLYSRP